MSSSPWLFPYNLNLVSAVGCLHGAKLRYVACLNAPHAYFSIAPGLSYWMYQGEKYHSISLEKSMKKHDPVSDCELEISTADYDADDSTPITVDNCEYALTSKNESYIISYNILLRLPLLQCLPQLFSS